MKRVQHLSDVSLPCGSQRGFGQARVFLMRSAMGTRLAILSAILLLVGTTALRETRARAQEGVPSPCVVTVPSK